MIFARLSEHPSKAIFHMLALKKDPSRREEVKGGGVEEWSFAYWGDVVVYIKSDRSSLEFLVNWKLA